MRGEKYGRTLCVTLFLKFLPHLPVYSGGEFPDVVGKSSPQFRRQRAAIFGNKMGCVFLGGAEGVMGGVACLNWSAVFTQRSEIPCD
jgi:hypothetical protein